MLITKLATDVGGDLHTLRQFRNWVFQQIKPEYESDFRQKLKEVKFDSRTEKILNKAENLRDNVYAHFKRDKLEQIPNLSLSELEELKNKLISLFDALLFNVEYEMLPPSYFGHQTDIEVILDLIAKNSELLNMPESRPEVWKEHKEIYNKEAIEIINKYRKKFNLPEV